LGVELLVDGVEDTLPFEETSSIESAPRLGGGSVSRACGKVAECRSLMSFEGEAVREVDEGTKPGTRINLRLGARV
jgi:hypothetical protein